MEFPVVESQGEKFEPLAAYVREMTQSFGASAASLIVIQNDRIVLEQYEGSHHHKKGAVTLSEQSLFNIYSVRKTYVCLAMAMAALENNIPFATSVHEIVNELEAGELSDLTLGDLAMATGPKYFGKQRIEREGIQGLVVRALTGKVISEYLQEKVFNRLGMKGTEWASVPHRNLVCDYTSPDQFALVRLESTNGHERNLYTSARDLATWGYLHLKKGCIDGNRIMPDSLFSLTYELKEKHPSKRILGWYHQDDGYYASGAAGCHCVVLPEHNAVGIRMLNKYTSDYKDDQIAFNRLLSQCLSK
ncbi:beta-lactamase family protein [Paenibacillus glycanilyticus]|uniref:serine hydrolase domain-containing protein n=1 Tax=Paenibacillus glycanilyticus TaxID=126569 RepID=UPI00203A4A86|nr:serine hydrolase domain-containing protein [Paenibacillus glycanilyticus]MCM3629761.1 beta-lactamase family protein [Paenibacillus glycanilyticus]